MIKIKIDEAYKCNGTKSLYITFPYDANIVNILRQLPFKYYYPDMKKWEVPYNKLEYLKEQFKNYDLDIDNSYENKFKQDLTQKEYNYIPSNYKFVTEPFKHQIEGIEFGLNNDKFLLRR